MKITHNQEKMFYFITKKMNPLCGKCPYNCVYCWARMLAKRYKMLKYLGEDYGFCELRGVKEDDFVFLQDMTDPFHHLIQDDLIIRILSFIQTHPKTTFLILTKNPARFLNFTLPSNIVLGATIETNRYIFQTPSIHFQYSSISKAPPPDERWHAMSILSRLKPDMKILICMEPILDFDLEPVLWWLRMIKPWILVVGYDNYSNKLPEPTLDKTTKLINEASYLVRREVLVKTLRKAWYE